MRAQTVGVEESRGRVLSAPVFHSTGRKLLARGHVVGQEDLELLRAEGFIRVSVAELDEGEVSEDRAVEMVARAMGCGSIEIRSAAGGRANLHATENCCLLLDDDLLKQINYTASVAIATGGNFTLARAGQRIATIKSTPFAVSAEQLDTVLELLRERGPLLQARPVRRPELAVVYCDPQDPARARAPYEPITHQRLARLGCEVRHSVQALETEEDLARCLDSLLRLRPTGILVASTTSPAGPTDAVGRAMTRVGCLIERFLAPVEPGTLFLMGYQGETPIVSAPGCFRSAKPNILDLVLPPILSRYRLSGWEVAALGAGGLLA